MRCNAASLFYLFFFIRGEKKKKTLVGGPPHVLIYELQCSGRGSVPALFGCNPAVPTRHAGVF